MFGPSLDFEVECLGQLHMRLDVMGLNPRGHTRVTCDGVGVVAFLDLERFFSNL